MISATTAPITRLPPINARWVGSFVEGELYVQSRHHRDRDRICRRGMARRQGHAWQM